mmetsp:Transcript_5958/g.18743  ORF Transcript_5958/g.18743 Transcript_5958/m.18743 type:complete len:357 (+) Transcript_5958:66-1136(+)
MSFSPVFPPNGRAKFERLGYSPAVHSGPLVLIAGQVGVTAEGEVLSDPEEQMRLAFRKVVDLVEEAGLTASDIAEVRTFHVDMDAHEATFFKVKSEFFPAPPYPAFTGLIEVKKLGMAGLLLEVAATAHQPAGPRPLEIGYWKIRGLGAPLRMMLAYSGIPHVDKQYTDDWFGANKERILAMNPLANLPYVVDGNECVCQSNSAYVHVADKAGLYRGVRDLELMMEVFDLRNAHVDLVYPFADATRSQAEFDKKAVQLCEKTLATYYAKFAAVLAASGGKYLCGDDLAAADFHLWEMIDQHELLAKRLDLSSPLVGFPRLGTYYGDFRAEPKLAAYFESPDYSLPVNSSEAGAYFA